MTASEQKLLTYTEVGIRIGGAKHRFVAKLIAQGRLRGVSLGYNKKRVTEMDLLRFLEESRTVFRGRRK